MPPWRDSFSVQDAHSLCQPECPGKLQSGCVERMRASLLEEISPLDLSNKSAPCWKEAI